MDKSSLLLQALKGCNEKRPPVWIMRQAGRYMASYRRIREKQPLMHMFCDKDLITEITLLPIQELDVDAAILFSDILLPFLACGCQIDYDKGPKVIAPPLEQILERKDFSLDQMKHQFPFVTAAIKNLKKDLKVPLIGFAGGPFTLASYLLDQEQHHLMKKTKTMLFADNLRFHALLESLTELAIGYLELQIDAGVDVLQIFDSWAGILDHEQFQKCSCFYLKKILKKLEPYGKPVILFCRGSSYFASELASLSPQCISVDWYRPLSEIAKQVPKGIALQGNLDPDFLRAPLPIIKEKTKELLFSMKEEKRFIANLGHGLFPEAKEEAVKCFVDTVKENR